MTQEEKDGFESRTASTLRVTRFISNGGDLSKRIRLVDGALQKEAAVHLSRGRFEVVHVDGAAGLAGLLEGLGHDQAISFGVPKNGAGSGRVVSRSVADVDGAGDALTRTRDSFCWSDGHGVLLVDCGAPSSGEPLARAALLDALYGVVPSLRAAGHVYWPSSSSCIYEGERELVGVRGQHVYVVTRDAADIERAGAVLARRLWLAGFGRVEISKAGALLERGLADALVWAPERLCFSAGAVGEAPLSQRRGPPLVVCDGAPLDTRSAVLPLTEDEERAYARLVRKAKAEAAPEAARARKSWCEARGEAIAKERAIPIEAATSIARDAVEHQRLRGDYVLTTEDGRAISVAEMLRDRNAWHTKRFRHPVDPECLDHRIAYANLAPSGGRPFLYCHSGPTKFTLVATAATVQVQAGNVVANVEAVVKAMCESRQFYVRGGDLCAIGGDGVLVALSHHSLKHRLDELIQFERWRDDKVDRTTGKAGSYVPIDAPDDLAQRVRSVVAEGHLPRINAVVHHPIVTADGRLLDEGFDEATRLLLVRSEARPWPRPRDCATLEEVHQALRVLWAPFREYALATDVDRGVLLAALLTAPVRQALPRAPAFSFAAPAAGSGKTILAQSVALLAGGAAPQALPATEDELSKTILAILRGGANAVLFDNVAGRLDSAKLALFLTADTFEGRILGETRTSAALPATVLTLFSGNNLQIVGDLFRRILTCYIDPATERPDARSFEFSPLAETKASKDRMIGAVLTILAAWVATPAFKTMRASMGSYTEFEALVIGAVLWLASEGITTAKGEAFGDPRTAIDTAHAHDEERAQFAALISAWAAGDPTRGFQPALGRELRTGDIWAALERLREGGVPRDDVAGAAAAAIHATGCQVRSAAGLDIGSPRARTRWLAASG